VAHENFSLYFRILSDWDAVESIRGKTKSEFEKRGWHKDFASDVSMCAAELSGNIVKYGVGDSDDEKKSITIEVKEKRVLIRTTNKVEKNEHLENVKTFLKKIRTSDLPERLHVKRLIEILKEPKHDATQLGFYRIAYEGEFDIECQYEDEILTITAVRQIRADDFAHSGGDHAELQGG